MRMRSRRIRRDKYSFRRSNRGHPRREKGQGIGLEIEIGRRIDREIEI